MQRPQTPEQQAGGTKSGLLWQPRFLDRAPQSVEEDSGKAEFDQLNPVTAGLVKRAEEKPQTL
jgi:hypothetical protein